MTFPNLDFELLYWRARRRIQRLRSAYRMSGVTARANAHLQYLRMFGRMPDRPSAEDTRAYRALWVCAVVMTAGVIAIDCIGEEEFRVRVDAAAAALKNLPERRAAARYEPPSRPELEVEYDKARATAWLKKSI
jgi:hypothetical protein